MITQKGTNMKVNFILFGLIFVALVRGETDEETESLDTSLVEKAKSFFKKMRLLLK